MRRNMPVVVAGTYQQFKSWCWQQGLHERDAFWVSDESRLRGLTLHRDQIRYVGTCADRRDFLDVEGYINMACARTDEAGFDWKDTERGKAHLKEVAEREVKQVDNREKRAILSDINVRLEKLSTPELAYVRSLLRSDRIFGGMRGPTPTLSYMDEPLSLRDEAILNDFGVEGLTREMMKPVRDAARPFYAKISDDEKARVSMEARIIDTEGLGL